MAGDSIASEVLQDAGLAEEIALKAIDLAIAILGAAKVGELLTAKQLAVGNTAADVLEEVKFGPPPKAGG